jgi:small-conductance mechanosensitive channel
VLTEPVTVGVGVAAAALPIAGFLIGLIATRVALRRTRRQERHATAVAIAAVKELVVTAFVIAGAFGSTVILPLNRATDAVARKVLLVLLLAATTLVASRLSAAGVRRFVLRGAGDDTYGSIFLNITRAVVLAIGSLIILQSLDISITPILTALGVGGLAVALALQDTLANLFAGIHVIASRYVKGGDYVKLESGEEGWVKDINWRHTSILHEDEYLILVPNATLATAILTNYNRPAIPIELEIELGVSYDSDLEKVEKVTLDVARSVQRDVPGALEEHEPWVWYDTFADYSINFRIHLMVQDYMSQFPVRSEFVKRLHKRYAAEGIEIPFPVQTVHWKEGAENRHNGDRPPLPRRTTRASGPLRQLLRRSAN